MKKAMQLFCQNNSYISSKLVSECTINIWNNKTLWKLFSTQTFARDQLRSLTMTPVKPLQTVIKCMEYGCCHVLDGSMCKNRYTLQ